MTRLILKTLALAVVAASLFISPSLAATVIDSFDLNSNTLSTAGPLSSQVQTINIAGNPAIRTLSVTSNGQAMNQVVVNSGQFDFASVPAGGVGKTEYSDFTVNASATPYLKFTIGTTLGAGQAEIGLTSSSAAGIIALFAPIPSNIASPTDLHFDMRTFAGYQPGFLTGVVSLAIAFTGATGNDYFLKVNEIALVTEDEYGATLPEPTMIALMVPAGFLWFARRKQRSARA